MQEDRHDLMAKAAWYYHVEGMTQAEIAVRLNLTRRRINEMLGEALESGIVTISFNSAIKECVELEHALCERFGLEAAVVVPTPRESEDIHKVIGRATAEFFCRFVQLHRPQAIAVGWGATLREAIKVSRPQRHEQMDVYSIMGGLTQGTEINTFEIVRGFAALLKARCHYLAAPIYMEDREARDVIISQSTVRRALDAVSSADVAVVSVGDMSQRSLQIRYGLPEDVHPKDLQAAGAVGDIVGRYLDVDGQELKNTINSRVVAPELDDFLKIPRRILASGGSHKHAIMRAVVQRGYANIVITDLDCAKSLG